MRFMGSVNSDPLQQPDGIARGHIEPRQGLHRHASFLSLLVLGAVLAAGLSGWLGEKRALLVVDNATGRFEILAPTIARNGNIIETRIRVEARKRIGQLVIGFEPDLWREITTNSTVPTAADESYADGLLRFSFAKLEAGEAFEWQIAQQINPSLNGINRGRVVFLDAKKPLAEVALALKVLP